MPAGSNPAKVAATRAYGAEVVTRGVTGENRETFAPSWPPSAACTWSTPSTTTT
jgi:threonine dehydratase